MTGRSSTHPAGRRRNSRVPTPAFALAATAFLALAACITGPPLLSPPPAHIEVLDGYGSLTLRADGGSLRGRFSFLLVPPDKGRIEVLDPLGRTRALLAFREGEAVMVLMSRKAYWSGPEAELMEGFLGFGLRIGELAGLIGGRWTEAGTAGPPESEGWTFEKGKDGRVLSGAKGEFRFRVEEFFPKTPLPRAVGFSRAGETGRLRVLQVRFNRPPRPEAFAPARLEGLERKTWPEMEELLRDAD